MSSAWNTCPNCHKSYVNTHECPFNIVLRHASNYFHPRDEGKLSGVNRALKGNPSLNRPQLELLRETLRRNQYLLQAPKNRPNFFNEGLAAYVLRGKEQIRDEPQVFESLPPLERAKYRQIIKDQEGTHWDKGTPDFIYGGKIADAFTVNVSTGNQIVDGKPIDRGLTKEQLENEKHDNSLKAINESLIYNALDKWTKYGKESIAIAIISELAPTITTNYVMAVINNNNDCEKAIVGRGNALVLVRGLSSVEFLYSAVKVAAGEPPERPHPDASGPPAKQRDASGSDDEGANDGFNLWGD